MCMEDQRIVFRSKSDCRSRPKMLIFAVLFEWFMFALVIAGFVVIHRPNDLSQNIVGVSLLSTGGLVFVIILAFILVKCEPINSRHTFESSTAGTSNATGQSHARNLHLPQGGRSTTTELHRCQQQRSTTRLDRPMYSDKPPSYDSLHQAQVEENITGLSCYLPTYEEVVRKNMFTDR
ncbi:uncharacterized protein LOC143446281 [Clavelina lepadiformis]|uniref:uncharacterized protein LOC143446281 n=1 Tax=Clavelina lepadiformis TaxID=159417 RepID=UPI004042BA17